MADWGGVDTVPGAAAGRRWQADEARRRGVTSGLLVPVMCTCAGAGAASVMCESDKATFFPAQLLSIKFSQRDFRIKSR